MGFTVTSASARPYSRGARSKHVVVARSGGGGRGGGGRGAGRGRGREASGPSRQRPQSSTPSGEKRPPVDLPEYGFFAQADTRGEIIDT
jgi:hypothetical protein